MEAAAPRVRRKSNINLRASLRRISIASSSSPAALLDTFPLPTPPLNSSHGSSAQSGVLFDDMPTPTSAHFPNASSHNPTASGSMAATSNATPDSLRAMVEKRITTFNYLKEAHEGRVFWFNTVLLTTNDLVSAFEHSKMKTRTTRLSILGMSLSSLLDITTAHDFLRGFLSLLQEFDSIQDDKFDRKGQKGLFRGSSKGRKSGGGAGGDLSSGLLQEAGDSSYLFTPNVPFDLDYFQVLFTTCDLLVEAYQKIITFIDPPHFSSKASTSNTSLGIPPLLPPTYPTSAASHFTSHQRSALTPAMVEMTLKLDARLKKVIASITKDIDAVARLAIKDELSLLGGGGEDWMTDLVAGV